MKNTNSLKDGSLMPGYYSNNQNDDYIQAVLAIAKKQGVKITDVMIKQEVKKRKLKEEDAWDAKKRKKLLKALEKIRGIWADDKDFDKRQRERDKIEIKAAKEMRKAW